MWYGVWRWQKVRVIDGLHINCFTAVDYLILTSANADVDIEYDTWLEADIFFKIYDEKTSCPLNNPLFSNRLLVSRSKDDAVWTWFIKIVKHSVYNLLFRWIPLWYSSSGVQTDGITQQNDDITKLI